MRLESGESRERSTGPAAFDAERWRRVAGVVEVALELDPPTRASYLETLGGRDEDLRRRVLAILRSMGVVGSHDEPTRVAAPASAGDDERIGPWRLLRLLGRGGMGAVFLAERDDAEYQRRAALKVIGDGFQEPTVYRRFLAERQILAAFDHPHIAKLYDAGTTRDGRPYLVMEYVEGEPVHRYCFDNELCLEARLDLFRKICSAVAYAHRQLVVHRDLKPTNILVAADGEPKLLDFGIAKLLEPESLVPFEIEATRTTQAVMTPNWASPEQLRGAAISTSSDVYSLGLLLCHLLTGKLPPRGLRALVEGSSEVSTRPSRLLEASTEVDVASEQERAWPSPLSAARQLRGDLDNIVMKALRPEPQKRYPSVEAFDEDVERFLDGRPVSATRDTPLYLLRKTVGRYRWQVVAAALFVLAILSTAGVALWQAERVRQERDRAADQARRAELQASRAEGSLAFLGDLLRAADETERAQEELSVRDLLIEALDRLEAGAVEAPEAKMDLLELLADAFFDFRDLPSSIRALELAHRTAVASDLPQDRRRDLLAELARIRIFANDQTDIEETCEALMAIASDPNEPAYSRCLVALEFLAMQHGDFHEVARLFQLRLENVSVLSPFVSLFSLLTISRLGQLGVIEEQRAVALLNHLARTAMHELSAEQAQSIVVEVASRLVGSYLFLDEAAKAKRISEWLAEERPALHRHDTVDGNELIKRAVMANRLGEVDEAFEYIDRAEAVARDMLEIDAKEIRARYLLARVPSERASLYRRLGQLERSRRARAEAVELYRQLARESDENFFVMRDFASNLMRAGHLEEARPIVHALLAKGYRLSSFVELAEESGLLPDPMPPPVDFELVFPPDLQKRFDAARHIRLPWELPGAAEEPEEEGE